jgi:glutaredoxin 3
MLTVYSTPACPGCTAVKALLLRFNIPFEVKMVTEDEGAKAFFKAKGHRSVPQVYAGDVYVGDFAAVSKTGAADLMALATKQQKT